MICIQNLNTDPYFNIASEEYLLKNFAEDCFMLYRNEKSVIIGKHQNALKEINIEFARKNNIKVVRRISGGGTVFHDLGNLNFMFIISGKEGHLIDFQRFTQPVVEVLKKLDLRAGFDGRNGLVVNGMKFSGNAEHVWKKRTLHHGTLLFSSKLKELSEVLKVNMEKYQDKAVKSVSSKVTNIQELLSEKMDIHEFRELLMTDILKSTKGAVKYDFSQKDTEEIEKLKKEKYQNWEWNFGYSPKYTFRRKIKIDPLSFEIEFRVERGIIVECKVEPENDFSGISKIQKNLLNCRHDPDEIRKRLLDDNFDGIFEEPLVSEIVKELF